MLDGASGEGVHKTDFPWFRLLQLNQQGLFGIWGLAEWLKIIESGLDEGKGAARVAGVGVTDVEVGIGGNGVREFQRQKRVFAGKGRGNGRHPWRADAAEMEKIDAGVEASGDLR